MKERHSYIGQLNGIHGIWCDSCPEGVEVSKEVIFYSPDEGKIFKKGEEYYDSVVIEDGVDIADYEEVDAPEQTQEPQEL